MGETKPCSAPAFLPSLLSFTQQQVWVPGGFTGENSWGEPHTTLIVGTGTSQKERKKNKKRKKNCEKLTYHKITCSNGVLWLQPNRGSPHSGTMVRDA